MRVTSETTGGGAPAIFPPSSTTPPTQEVLDNSISMSSSNNKESFPLLMAALPPLWEHQVCSWLQEDAPGFDIGGFVVGDRMTVAFLFGKSRGVLCGVPFVNALFEELKCSVEWLIKEGEMIDPKRNSMPHSSSSSSIDFVQYSEQRKEKGEEEEEGPTTNMDGKIVVAVVRGKARNVLLGERTVLNILSRASGIATEAHDTVAIAHRHGWHGAIAGTRKMSPGFRMVEKYALLVGGAATHRQNKSHMVLLRDNHIWSAGSITKAIQQARSAGGFSVKIEVEVRSIDQGLEAARAGAEMLMLDHFNPEKTKEMAAQIKAIYPHIAIEASGGITKENIARYFSPHIDVISRGSLTQGVKAIDYSLQVQRAHDHIKKCNSLQHLASNGSK